jgi:peptidoglycan hydrolase-like protein with peptidoglycan-binding domain
MADIDAQAGLARAEAKHTNAVGMCLNEVWKDYGSVNSEGPHAGQYPIAYNGWLYSEQQHPGDANPPVGVPVYFGPSPTRTDANKNAGDVGISIGGGYGWFTDVGPNGVTGVMSLAARARQTARPYMGWTSDFLGNQLVNIGPVTGAPGVVTASQDVKNRQAYLNATFNAGLVVDGIVGPKTKAAIAAYQRVLGITADGIWGPQTEAAHEAYVAAHAPAPAPAPAPSSGNLQVGSTGDAVRALQIKLKTNYPAYAKNLAADGIFGPATKAAVMEFQRRSGITVDGIVGPVTRAKLGL